MGCPSLIGLLKITGGLRSVDPFIDHELIGSTTILQLVDDAETAEMVEAPVDGGGGEPGLESKHPGVDNGSADQLVMDPKGGAGSPAQRLNAFAVGARKDFFAALLAIFATWRWSPGPRRLAWCP